MRSLSILLILQAVSFGLAFQIGGHNRLGAGVGGTSQSPHYVQKITTSTADRLGMSTMGTSISKPSSLKMSQNISDNNNQHKRRSFIQNLLAQSIVFSSVVASSGASAEAVDAKITHKVYFDVRISRADGTFYVRDDTEPDNEPFYGQLVFGLFGNATPNHTKEFLSFVEVPYEVDNPLPSYSKSKFPTIDTSTGLLIGGTIPGLDVTTLAGGNVLEYSGRVIPAKLWLEDKDASSTPLSHDTKGLLTHRNLDVTPSFGITTRNESKSLDATHTIFGCILEDKSGFLDFIVDLPVLTDGGRVSRTEENVDPNAGVDVGGSLASSVFTAQRAIFRDAAKTFGDSRLEKVYDGKLLRRIEVTKVGVL